MRESYCLKNSFLNIGFLLRFVLLRSENQIGFLVKKPKTIVRNEMVLTAKQGLRNEIPKHRLTSPNRKVI